MESPEKKVQKEAEDLLARLQEAREKPQFVLFNKEGKQLIKVHIALLGNGLHWLASPGTSPDGRYLAFAEQSTEANAFLFEND
jgi:Tol biopolymer transport system component